MRQINNEAINMQQINVTNMNLKASFYLFIDLYPFLIKPQAKNKEKEESKEASKDEHWKLKAKLYLAGVALGSD